MNEPQVITRGDGCIEATCPVSIDHQRGIVIPPDVLNTILQQMGERIDWRNAQITLTDLDA